MRRLWILALLLLLWGCGKNVETQVSGVTGSEPDRVLYDQAMKDLGKNRFMVARLTLQTLINTYPDSEFLPEAKYALAESYFREGATSNLNQSEVEFRDYITFFPASERADDAQLMIAKTHLKQLEKSDRDPTQAQLGEMELNRMIESYPDSPLLDEAKQLLRGVQELLAEGDFKIGNHYLIRRAYGAAVSRYREVLDKYPDYSETPQVLFNMAEALRRADNPESVIYYSRIVTDYPYSPQVAEAKQQLTGLNKPIPEPNPAAVARGQQQVKDQKGIFGRFFGGFGRRPSVTGETDAANPKVKDDRSDTKTDSDKSSSGGGSVSIETKASPDKPKKPR